MWSPEEEQLKLWVVPLSLALIGTSCCAQWPGKWQIIYTVLWWLTFPSTVSGIKSITANCRNAGGLMKDRGGRVLKGAGFVWWHSACGRNPFGGHERAPPDVICSTSVYSVSQNSDPKVSVKALRGCWAATRCSLSDCEDTRLRRNQSMNQHLESFPTEHKVFHNTKFKNKL